MPTEFRIPLPQSYRIYLIRRAIKDISSEVLQRMFYIETEEDYREAIVEELRSRENVIHPH